MTDDEIAEDWARGEAEYFDRVRVRGFMLALGDVAKKAHEKVVVAERRLTEARENAERALAEEGRILDFADAYGKMILRDDPEEYSNMAALLERLVG